MTKISLKYKNFDKLQLFWKEHNKNKELKKSSWFYEINDGLLNYLGEVDTYGQLKKLLKDKLKSLGLENKEIPKIITLVFEKY